LTGANLLEEFKGFIKIGECGSHEKLFIPCVTKWLSN
jgi:hypothetical protein